MPQGKARKSIIREIRRLHARREPLNISAVKRNHPKLIERVYAVRPFWGWKRALEDAGLDYSKINTELRNYVDCKICGQDFGALTYHLISQHQITPDEYREEHPGVELVCETLRVGIAQRRLRHRPVLPHWEEIWSPEYVLDRMAELHRRKFPINSDSVRERENALFNQAIKHFGSWDIAVRRIGLDPAQIRLFRPTWRGISPWRRSSKTAIIAELRHRKKAKEPISWKKIVHTEFGPAFLLRATKLFGTWGAALAAAGLDPFGGARSHWTHASKAAVLAEIRRRKSAGEPLLSKEIQAERWGQALVIRGCELFGSWNAALLEVGIESTTGPSEWADATKKDIVAEIRRRKRAGEPLRTTKILRESRGRALLDNATRLFGSWNRALLAAGIQPFKETSPWARASKADILAEIRRRAKTGETLQTTKVEREKFGNPLMNRCRALFGSWTAALLAAGVDLPDGLMSLWAKADKAQIVAEVRRRARAGETLRYGEVVRQPWGSALLKRAELLFGLWSAGLIAAGVDLPAGTFSPWPKANKADILAEIRRRKRARESLRYKTIETERWGKPLLRRAKALFGSWDSALLRALGTSALDA
jgi:hypothetical protein